MDGRIPSGWLAGRWMVDKPWELLGIYDSEQEAVKRCRIASDFVGPIYMGVDLPESTTPWLGSYYPHQQAGVPRPRPEVGPSDDALEATILAAGARGVVRGNDELVRATKFIRELAVGILTDHARGARVSIERVCGAKIEGDQIVEAAPSTEVITIAIEGCSDKVGVGRLAWDRMAL